jgi:hypothetical protein
LAMDIWDRGRVPSRMSSRYVDPSGRLLYEQLA